MTLDEQHRLLLADLKEDFDAELLWFENLIPDLYRDDVSKHCFSDCYSEPTEQRLWEIRRWIENRGWQFSRQFEKNPANPDRLIEFIYLAPMIFVDVERGYHATRLVSVPSIQEKGLLPSIPQRQTTEATERGDCEGNIYICDALGTPSDAGIRDSKSAHWWRDHFATKNRFNDPAWVILEIQICEMRGAKLYLDIWSESGIIVGGIEAIPPELIRLVY